MPRAESACKSSIFLCSTWRSIYTSDRFQEIRVRLMTTAAALDLILARARLAARSSKRVQLPADDV